MNVDALLAAAQGRDIAQETKTHFNGIIHVLFLDGKLYEVYTNTPGFQERKW